MTETALNPNITAGIFVEILEALERYDPHRKDQYYSTDSSLSILSLRMGETTTTPPPHAPDSCSSLNRPPPGSQSLWQLRPVRLLCSPLLGIAEIRDDQLCVSSSFSSLRQRTGVPPAKPPASSSKASSKASSGGGARVLSRLVLRLCQLLLGCSRGVDLVAARVARQCCASGHRSVAVMVVKRQVRISKGRGKIDDPEVPKSDDDGGQ